MLAKESIKERALEADFGPVAAGVLAGAGGGVAQVSVMGPCTFLVREGILLCCSRLK